MSDGTPVMWMRGGTSKGAYFLASDLPACPIERDTLLLRFMGSPDPRQIDGIGGADPLTSKVAVVRSSRRDGIDVDYLFLQVFVDQPIVTNTQNCGNILAGVGPFAIERGLVRARDGETPVTIYMENTGQTATARVQTPKGRVTYTGETRIDGVPKAAAPVSIAFRDTSGSNCGALFPSGNVTDVLDGVEVTLIDNGMPCVIMRAVEMGITGAETPTELEADEKLRARLEAIRLQAGLLMNLGDVSDMSVPKLTMVSAPRHGGSIATRTFIPHRCHKTIGVLGAVSVATACLTNGAVGNDLCALPQSNSKKLSIEHPTGETTVVSQVDDGAVNRAEVLRTARKLIDGKVF
jgi:4-oxalomesaconate tautomerase